MHGELLKARCVTCDAIMSWPDDLSIATPCPSCGRAGGLRPHVVWFGEMPLFMDRIYDGLLDADLFVAIGTSGSVYPAAGFVSEAEGTASAPVRSTWNHPTTLASSMNDVMDRRVILFLYGLRMCLHEACRRECRRILRDAICRESASATILHRAVAGISSVEFG